MTQTEKSLDIGDYITERFVLFSGLRSEEEDRKIFERVYAHCLAEIWIFLEENLSPTNLQEMSRRLESIEIDPVLESKNQHKKELIMEYLGLIKDSNVQLTVRLKAVVDKIYSQAVGGKHA